jgi:DNA polymerase III subunit delta'
MHAYLSKHQPQILQLFEHALTYKKISHAYLLSGKPNTPLLDVARFLAKSLVCENASPFADLTCSTCQRIDAGDYVDLKVMNGALESIKKADVLSLEHDFSISSLEVGQKQIYILHRVEHMTPEAVNALLKFLEEPQQDIYAFLTTEAKDHLLPTIISRTQTIQFRPVNQQDFLHELLQDGLSEEDAQLLSLLTTTIEQAKKMNDSSFYTSLKASMKKWFALWAKKPAALKMYARESIFPLLHDEDSVRLFLQWMLLLVEETQRLYYHQPLVLTQQRDVLLLLNDGIIKMTDIMSLHRETLHRLRTPVVLPLLLDQYLIQFMKGLRIV